MQKNTISLCMIVKNEEKYLDKCLKCVQGKVDEIIIVDTGSTDRTVEIAEKYGSIIKYFEWIDDFAAARNYSIDAATSEYILILDADEYIDDGADLQKELEKNKDYYSLTIKNYQTEGRAILHKNVRLFKSGIGLHYSGKLHEHLNTFGEDNKYEGTDSDILIHHVGYMPEVVKEKGKKKRNLDIMIKEVEKNQTGYSYYNMGVVYMQEERYNEALDMFKKSYSLSKGKTYVRTLLVHMGECLQLLGRHEEGIKLLLDAVSVYSGYIDLHYTLGNLYLNSGYLKDAQIVFERCLGFSEELDNVGIEGTSSYMSNYKLAVIYDMKGKQGDAFDRAYEAVMRKRSFTPALSLYLKIMQRAGINPTEIKEQLDKIYAIDTAEDIKALIYSLYETRHPLLYDFLFIFEDFRLADMRAVALMLNKQYDNSLREWEKADKVSKDSVLDAAVLCLLTQNTLLVDKIKECLNFSNKEWKFIRKLILKESIDKPYLTPEVEKMIYNISEYLINIGEFDLFEYISSYLMQCSAEILDKTASLLLDYNFTDTAMDLLSTSINNYPARSESYILLGDAYKNQGKIDEALECYKVALNQQEEYRIYEKIYDAYEAKGDRINKLTLKNDMKEKYPLSLWLKGIDFANN